MANQKDIHGITLRKYGTAIRDRWPLKKGWVIGAKTRSQDQAKNAKLPINQWDLRWTVTLGAKPTVPADANGQGGRKGVKGRTITLDGGFSGPRKSNKPSAGFATVHEAYLLYYKVSGAKVGKEGMPPQSNPSMSMVDPQWQIPPEEFAKVLDAVIANPPEEAEIENWEVGTPSIDVNGDRPFRESRRASAEFSPITGRARELLHAYTLMETDREALKQEMGSFSVVFNSTKELRTTEEAQLLALAVAGKLTARGLAEKLDTPKRDKYSFKHDGVSIALVGAFFRCTSCELIKPGSAFGMRRMTETGEFRNQAQCGECRSVHEHSNLAVVEDQANLA